nr:ribokinase [uncultured Acidocella sp.]
MLVIGSANMDVVVRADRAPAAGETVLGLDYALYPGGKGANQAIAARRAGAQVKFCACLGEDSHGTALQAALAADGVELSCLRHCETPSGVALITVEASGENRIIVVPGANHRLTPEMLPDSVPPGTLLLAQLEVPIETVLAGAAKIRAAGGCVVLNPSPIAGLAETARARLLEAADVVLANESEAAALLGMPTLADPALAARRLAQGRRAAVITQGAKGVVWAGGEEHGEMPAHDITPLDTTACGDAFAGAFAAALEEGAALARAVRFGNAAGALAALTRGAQPSLPRRDAILARLALSP